jgi:hypothetical protein
VVQREKKERKKETANTTAVELQRKLGSGM